MSNPTSERKNHTDTSRVHRQFGLRGELSIQESRGVWARGPHENTITITLIPCTSGNNHLEW